MDGIITNTIVTEDGYNDYKLLKAVEAMLQATSADDLMRIIAEQREELGYTMKDRKEELP